MFNKFIWFIIRTNLKLAAVLLIALMLIGAFTHTDFGMHWVANTPIVAVVEPTTGDLIHKIQPIKTVAMLGYLLDDLLLNILLRR